MLVLKSNWEDYELVDSGNQRRLERFGRYTISRPDPQCLWKPDQNLNIWEKCDAEYKLLEQTEKGEWRKKEKLPEKWLLKYKNISLWVKLSPFKHTGVFPEQISHWNWLQDIIRRRTIKSGSTDQLNILNLFAYTGGATLVCASAGTKVTHLDASRPAISWARENQIASQLVDKPIRWILDDAIKFLRREIKRGIKYDGVIMDPPVYGHGPTGERWDFYKDFPTLLELCRAVLSQKPLFILVNAYALSASFYMLENLLQDLKLKGYIESGELVLEQKNSNKVLSTGIFSRWSGDI